jgi:hypothetical protein
MLCGRPVIVWPCHWMSDGFVAGTTVSLVCECLFRILIGNKKQVVITHDCWINIHICQARPLIAGYTVSGEYGPQCFCLGLFAQEEDEGWLLLCWV